MVKAITIGKKKDKLYEQTDFVSCKPTLEPLKNKFTFDNDTEEEINAKLDDLEAASVFGLQPDYSLIRMVHRSDEGKITKLAFSIRPKGSFRLVNVPINIKGRFEILAGANFYEKFVEDLGSWFDYYNQVAFCTYNAYVLTKKVYEVANKNAIELPFALEFTMGEGIVEVSNSKLTIGLPQGVLMALDANPLMSSDVDSLTAQNIEAIVVAYLGFENLYDAIRTRNSAFAKTFGLSNRKLGTQVQRTCSKKLKAGKLGLNAHVSVITDEKGNEAKYITLINRIAVDEATAAEYQAQGAIITDNVTMTKAHTEGGLTKVANVMHLNPVFHEGEAPFEFERDLSSVTLEHVLKEAEII